MNEIQREAFAELLAIHAVLEGRKRYVTFSDGQVFRSRHLKPLLHNGKKPRK